MAGRSRIRGGKSFRRIMRQLPDAMREELVTVLRRTEPEAIAIVRQRIAATTTRRTGNLSAGVKAKTSPRTLKMQAGFLGTKRGRAKLFYARILDLGRKAQSVNVTRRRGAAPYTMKVTAIAPKRFVTGRIDALRAAVQRNLRGIWDRGLRRISGGSE